MKFRAHVEPPEPMRGLEVPQQVVEALGGGKRPTVTITINGHSWGSRAAIMRGRYLIGLSHATARPRQAGTSFESQATTSRQAVREPAHRDLSTLRPDSLPSRPGRTAYPKSQ
jgi:hypothetical protein